MAEVIQIDQHTWRIEDEGVCFFLLEGEEKALMIDSGMNTPDALDIVLPLTGKPIELINSRVLISGDTVSTSSIFMFGRFRSFETYRHDRKAVPLLRPASC